MYFTSKGLSTWCGSGNSFFAALGCKCSYEYSRQWQITVKTALVCHCRSHKNKVGTNCRSVHTVRLRQRCHYQLDSNPILCGSGSGKVTYNVMHNILPLPQPHRMGLEPIGVFHTSTCGSSCGNGAASACMKNSIRYN